MLLLHLLHLVGTHVVVQHWVHHRGRRGTQMLGTVGICGGFKQLLVIWVILAKVVVGVGSSTVMHLVGVLVVEHLHNAIVLLILHHVVIHASRWNVARIHQLLLLLLEHVHRGRS